MIYFLLAASVVGVSFGQILFKKSALSLSKLGKPWMIFLDPHFLSALGLYSLATVVWIWALQYIPLGRAYSLMSLAFILVPLLGHHFFHEPLGVSFVLGSVLIAAGVILTALR